MVEISGYSYSEVQIRLKGDMIETYKVLSGIYDTSVSTEIPII